MEDISFFDTEKKPKILRDLVHGYINLSKFDLKIIDTPHFQRLKDIRQLTAQHVYPDARHTRFEHSLGVMELTRQAIKHLNDNKFLSDIPAGAKDIIEKNKGNIISKDIEFNASIAALLHDIGHCPFSHLGERQFEVDDNENNEDKNSKFCGPKGKLRQELIGLMQEKKIEAAELDGLKEAIENHEAVHELLSCIIILRVYHTDYGKIKKAVQAMISDTIGLGRQVPENIKKTDKMLKAIDFEFIVRCILGVPYKDTSHAEISIKNIMIRLISSDALDMDKLDYIMRDAFYTGINVPTIDTKRLFKNMYISKQYELVYKSKAVPVLQNIIESRDNLYLWVYNHHTVVYTDFLYYYIFRRLHHNAVRHESEKQSRGIKPIEIDGALAEKNKYNDMDPTMGTMKREVLFSLRAIKNRLVSDSSLHYHLLYSYRNLSRAQGEANSNKEAGELFDKEAERIYFLLWHLFRRELLKPWWKTIFEYENFMNSRISDDKIRAEIAKRVCSDTDGIKAAEFRSQIAKGVILLSENFEAEGKLGKSLKDGDFFIVERSNRFYTLGAIQNFTVYLKKNEIVNPDLSAEDLQTQENDYFGKFLSKLLPQKNYEKFFNKDSFYLYIRPYENIRQNNNSPKKHEKMNVRSNENSSQKYEDERFFYEKIEKIFISVSMCLASMTNAQFEKYRVEYDNAKKTNGEPKTLETNGMPKTLKTNDMPKTLMNVKKTLERSPPFYESGRQERKDSENNPEKIQEENHGKQE